MALSDETRTKLLGVTTATLTTCLLKRNLRNQWLQEALELLEPRQTGRPPKRPASDELLERVAQLESEKRDLEQQLRFSEAREQVVAITAATSPSSTAAVLKKTERRRQRRRAQRRPR